MLSLLRKLIKPRYETLNRIEIEGRKILSNYDLLKERQGGRAIFPVVKSNAYGHGLREICRLLNHTDAPMVCVDSFPEAQLAWRYFRRQILIMGEMPLRAYGYCRFSRTEFVVYDTQTLQHLSRWGKKARIHLFINSGMNREGIADLESFIRTNKRYLDRVEVAGLCSHLASADEESILNEKQEEEFLSALDVLRAHGYFPRWVHLANSAAHLKRHNQVQSASRVGLALYGYDPFPDRSQKLQPALRVYSKIISVQRIAADEPVSYNASYRSSRPTNIAIIPFGYCEGLDRRLSNRARLLISGPNEQFLAPVAGKVCMNLCCLDAGDHVVHRGDSVLVMSDRREEPNSIEGLADLMDTIPYEVLVRLQPNIRRELVI